jgi:hypothetical protein
MAPIFEINWASILPKGLLVIFCETIVIYTAYLCPV